MTCREISPEVLRNAKSLEDVYTALGVLKPAGAPNAAPIAPPRTFIPEGSPISQFPYLTGTDGRNFNLAPLFAQNREQYTCALKAMGYNEDRAKELAAQSETMNDSEFAEFVKGLSSADSLTFNIHRTLKVMEFLRTDPPNGDKRAGGNTDGNKDVISAEEIENWAWERTSHDEKLYRQFGGDAIARLHALLGIAAYLATPEETKKDPNPKAPDAGAPDPVASSGPRVVSSSVPADAGPPKEPTGSGGSPNPTPADGGDSSWLAYVIGGAAGGSLLTALLIGLRRGFGGGNNPEGPKHPDAKAAVRQQQVEDEGIPSKREKKPRVVEDNPQPKESPSKPQPKVVKDTTQGAQGGAKAVPDDIADALKDLDSSKSPAGGAKPSNPPALLGGVTSDNVIISGPNAEAVSGVDAHVIRAQIVLTYRHFLSQTARDALLAGKELPAGADLVNSAFAERVTEMVDAVMREYHKMTPEALSDMWKTQREDRNYIVRRGAPQRLVMSACGDFITADAARSQSPFAGGTGAEIRTEAERRSGETDFFEKGMREILKDPVRLGR